MQSQSDPFWNEVLKRLATAGEENMKLIRERDDLQQERDKLRKQVDEMRGQPHVKHDEVEIINLEERTVDVNKLNELEEGIRKAQDSYQNIENKLKANNAKIEELALNNQRLRRERDELESRCRVLTESVERAEANLSGALSQSCPQDTPTSISTASHVTAGPAVAVRQADTALVHTSTQCCEQDTHRDKTEVNYKDRVVVLEREIEHLTIINKELEREKLRYQRELKSTAQKLSKYRNSDQSLREKLVKLGELTRQKSFHSRTSSMNSGSQMDSTSIKSERIASSVSSMLFPSASSAPKPSRRRTLERLLDATGRLSLDLTQIEEGNADEDQTPTPRPGFSGPSKIPSFRQSDLRKFPLITPGINIKESDNAFSREFMTRTLGGSIQPLMVRVANQSSLSKLRDVRSYLCPSLDHNPWCPSTPGEHGYIFVGLGREKTTFMEPEIHNIFVGTKKTKDLRRFRYMGKYRAVRVHSLTVAEWHSLDLKVRMKYANTTKEKTKDPRSVADIVSAYDSGELTVPCVQLRCIDFDESIYSALIAEAAKPSTKIKKSSSSSSPNKRALDGCEADNESTRKRRTMRRIPG